MMRSIKKPILVFLPFIVIVAILVIYVAKISLPIKGPLVMFEKKQTSEKPNFQAVGNKVLIKYSELNIFMKVYCGLVLKNIKSERDGNSVKVSGEASFPFSGDFSGNIVPYVENGTLKFRIQYLRLGKVEMPRELADKLNILIQKGFDTEINSKFKVKDVKITEEGVEIGI